MSRMYAVMTEVGAVTAAAPLLYIKSNATAVTIIHSLTVSQEDVTTDDNMVIELYRASSDATGGATLTGTQAAAGVVAPLDTGDPAYAGTIVSENTGGATSAQILYREGFSVLLGMQKIWTPEARPVLSGSERVVVYNSVTISSATVTVQMVIEEIGT